MPPKKSLEDQLASLPEAPTLHLLLLPDMTGHHFYQLSNTLASIPYSFLRTLPPQRMLEYLKDKGIISQKKDAGGKGKQPVQEKKKIATFQQRQEELKTILEETGPILMKNFQTVVQESSFSARREKQAKNEPVDDKKAKAPPKKDAKSKVVEEPPEETKPAVIDPVIAKGHDTFTFILDMPRNVEQAEAICSQVDIVIELKEQLTTQSIKVDLSFAQIPSNPEGDLKAKMASFQERGMSKQASFKQGAHQFQKEQREAIKAVKNMREEGKTKAIILKKNVVIDVANQVESYSMFLQDLFRSLGVVSLKIMEYKAWIKDRTVVPYIEDLYGTQAEKKPPPVQQQKPPQNVKKGAKKQSKAKEPQVQAPPPPPPQKKRPEPNLSLEYFHTFQHRLQSQAEGVYKGIVKLLLQNINQNNSKRFPSESAISRLIQKPESSWLTLQQINYLGQPCPHLVDIQTQRIISFLGISTVEFQRREILRTFSSMLKKYDPLRKWDFSDRSLAEPLSHSDLQLRFVEIMDRQPHIIQQIHRSGLLLRAYYFQNPPGRTYVKGWRAPYQALPHVEDFVNHFDNQSEKEYKEFFNFDSKKYGLIGQEKQYFMPSDNSMLVTCRRSIGGKQSRCCTAYLQHSKLQLRECQNLQILDVEMGINKNCFINSFDGNKTSTVYRWGKYSMILQDNIMLTSDDKQEQSRFIFGDGTIRRTLRNGVVQILMPSGDKAIYSEGNLRKEKVQIRKEKEAARSIIYRSDGTIICLDKQTKTCFFSDGTVIQSTLDHATIQIRSTVLDLPIVRLRTDLVKSKEQNIIGMSSSLASTGSRDLLKRAVDSSCFEIFFDNGISVYSFREKMETEAYKVFNEKRVSLIAAEDQSIFMIRSDGQLAFIEGSIRQKINMQDPHQYWLQLFGNPIDHIEGIYDIDLKKGILFTRDAQRNYFELGLNTESRSEISVSLQLRTNHSAKPPPRFTGSFIEKENLYLPISEKYIEPRLFVLKHDGTGQELTNLMQMRNFFDHAQNCPEYRYAQDNHQIQICKVRKPYKRIQSFSSPLVPFKCPPMARHERPSTVPISKKAVSELLWHRSWLKYARFELQLFEEELDRFRSEQASMRERCEKREIKQADNNQWEKLNFLATEG